MPEDAPIHSLFPRIQQGIFAWAGSGSPVVAMHIRPNSRMSAGARFAVYSRDYYGRMRDVLRQDHAVVAAVLGEDSWREVADAFILSHPSRHPNVNLYGGEFEEFLRRGGPGTESATLKGTPWQLLADVARLERAVAQAPLLDLHAPLQAEAVAALPESLWPEMRLTLGPGVRVLELSWPVNALLDAFHGPGLSGLPASPEPQFVQVWHQGGSTWRRQLTPVRAALLSRLGAGAKLAECLEAASRSLVEHGESTEGAAAAVQSWFAEWMADGIFASMDANDAG